MINKWKFALKAKKRRHREERGGKISIDRWLEISRYAKCRINRKLEKLEKQNEKQHEN